MVQQAVLRCVPVFCVCRWSPESFPRPSGRRKLVPWERLHHVFTSHIWEPWLTRALAIEAFSWYDIACWQCCNWIHDCFCDWDGFFVLSNALVALGSGLLCARPFAFIGQRQRASQVDSCWTSWHHEGPRGQGDPTRLWTSRSLGWRLWVPICRCQNIQIFSKRGWQSHGRVDARTPPC